ncbi:hypothetical protein TPHA_0C04820 [Tetrapisispora phaffii CBS 4417]|uniref:Squalene synthase n=1 Tax=Tetrapisispora phaffii (strain ATCC 24235 / CBS 4417 / NBRC 1672 / NRRL Y-8282 / UCD 70-5) TaxID=1071381 RepID=G8BQW9_TETPH|nr:hypothetical protein TPHA_0C04820 [Tetrapisispora phaffii CBS 4417]CCE62631.1 hypothetical protein TPHA_0C04820 [Tetrapisispora phaffii CBS 4417]
MVKITEVICHPIETRSSLLLKLFRCERIYEDVTINVEEDINGKPTKNLVACYELLRKTSKSFYLMILQLHPNIRNIVMIYYLVLRALDTIEDRPNLEATEKTSLLEQFHLQLGDVKAESNEKNSILDGEYSIINQFQIVLNEYNKLEKFYKVIIRDSAQKMGTGMSKYLFIESDAKDSLNTVKEYNEYCHYVAGVVGEGLSKIFVKLQFNFDNSNHLIINERLKLYEHLGLFLQKTNIIRSFHKDYEKYNKSYWPREIWIKYIDNSKDAKLATIEDLINSNKRIDCLNEMIINAVSDHMKEILLYISLIEEQSIFEFCAVPQVMAIATLAMLYNNDKVFTSDNEQLKIRKTETGYILYNCRTLLNVTTAIKFYLSQMLKKSKGSNRNDKLATMVMELDGIIDYKMFPEEAKNPVTDGVREDDYNIFSKQRNDKIDKKTNEIDFKIEENNFLMILWLAAIIIAVAVYFVFFFEPPTLRVHPIDTDQA